MPILGLKTLPVNHPLHRVYQVSAGVVGVLLAALGVLALVSSGDEVLWVLSASDRFAVFLLVAGAVLIGAAFVGGNVAAHVNADVGAVLILVGLLSLLVLHQGDANLLRVEMSDLMVLFVAGMVLLAAGFYGQVGEVSPHDVDHPERNRPEDRARSADTADLRT
jgi:hypothetical protein